MKKIFALAVALFLALMPFPALADVVERTDLFYAADYAHVLADATINDIVSKNDALYAQTGAQIVVVTVDTLDGMDIEDYAYTLFNDWGIGSAEKNNGVLLLLAIVEDNYWAVQGKGLEDKLSSGDLGNILYDYLERDFAAKDYDAGVRKVFAELYNRVSLIYGGISQSAPNNGGVPQFNYGYERDYGYDRNRSGADFGFGTVLLILFVIFIMVILVVISTIGRAVGGVFRPWIGPRYGGWWWGRPRYPFGRPPPPPPRFHSNRRGPGGGSPGGGGGFTRGGGTGRGGGGFSGGSRGGGGGSSRGGGAGRR